MTEDGLFAIDVAAEVATLCESQLQGPWQVPAELVRLAAARAASRIDVRRVRGGLQLLCDTAVASRGELADLAAALDDRVRPGARQEAIARLEASGAGALLWAAGARGASFELRCAAPDDRWGIEFRAGRARAAKTSHLRSDASGSSMCWRSGRRIRRRAVAWLETALRFLPIPATLDDRRLERGFPDGLYRMRIDEPLPAELAVTASGDMPSLWLLQHGVLAARAVVPGYPAFSAALEMSGVVPPGSSPAELRSAANPYLPVVIERAVTMLVHLGSRLPSVDEPVRRRISGLLLRAAELGMQRPSIVDLPLVPVRTAGERRLASPAELAGLASGRGGVLPVADGRRGRPTTVRGPVVEPGADERRLLSGLLGVRFEQAGAGRERTGDLRRLREASRRILSHLRGLVGFRAVEDHELVEAERCVVEAAGRWGIQLAFAAGTGRLRRHRGRFILGRDSPAVRLAVRAAAADDGWLYPALLAWGVGPDEIPEAVRASWLGRWRPTIRSFEAGGGAGRSAGRTAPSPKLPFGFS